MKKEQLEIELNKILNEVLLLETQAELQNQTTSFLGQESDKLMVKANDESLSFEEKELVCKQMESMQRRLMFETNDLKKDIKRLAELTEKLNYYQSLTVDE